MSKNISSLNHTVRNLHSDQAANASLVQEYKEYRELFERQPELVQRFIEAQARKLAEAMQRNQTQTSFTLPNEVVVTQVKDKSFLKLPVPAEYRDQSIGGVINRITRMEMRSLVRQRLTELEGSPEPAVAAGASLLRYALAVHMIYNMLPTGRSVKYRAAGDEEIPTIPADENIDLQSAITQGSDAIVEDELSMGDQGTFQVPFVPAARLFYLPQWVAFDDQGNLLVNSVNEAEAHLSSMQAYIAILHSAVSLAPYLISEPVYQQKRYGMLGQLINQGRALALYETIEMIEVIKKRAAAHDLNRGLSLSLPYFDDQSLELCTHDFEVIPAGRIMFVPAFVVRAARGEEAKAAQDTRLSPSTRKYLLAEFSLLEKAFLSPTNS
jgi:hypothetical protein